MAAADLPVFYVYVSADSGATWQRTSAADLPFFYVYVSADSGATWQRTTHPARSRRAAVRLRSWMAAAFPNLRYRVAQG